MSETRRGFLKWVGAGAAVLAMVKPSAVKAAIARPRVTYASRTIRHYLDVEAIRDRNVLLRAGGYAGFPTVSFRNVPIRVVGAADE